MWCEIALPAVGLLGLVTGMWLESRFNPQDWGQADEPDEHESMHIVRRKIVRSESENETS